MLALRPMPNIFIRKVGATPGMPRAATCIYGNRMLFLVGRRAKRAWSCPSTRQHGRSGHTAMISLRSKQLRSKQSSGYQQLWASRAPPEPLRLVVDGNGRPRLLFRSYASVRGGCAWRPAVSVAQDDRKGEESAPAPLQVRLKVLVREHGATAVVTYFGIWCLVLSSTYGAFATGLVDVHAVGDPAFMADGLARRLEGWGLDAAASWLRGNREAGGHLAVALLVTAMTDPLRIAAVLAITPSVSKTLISVGLRSAPRL